MFVTNDVKNKLFHDTSFAFCILLIVREDVVFKTALQLVLSRTQISFKCRSSKFI